MEIEHVLMVHQGNTQFLRVNNQKLWYVTDEAWEGSHLLNSTILSTFKTKSEAKAFAAQEAKNRD